MPQFTGFVNDNGMAIKSQDDFTMGIVKKDIGLLVEC